jgi:hypothetical protein
VGLFVLPGLLRAPTTLEHEDQRKEHGDASEAHPEPVLALRGRLVGLRLQGQEPGTDLLQIGRLRLDTVDDRQVREFRCAATGSPDRQIQQCRRDVGRIGVGRTLGGQGLVYDDDGHLLLGQAVLDGQVMGTSNLIMSLNWHSVSTPAIIRRGHLPSLRRLVSHPRPYCVVPARRV